MSIGIINWNMKAFVDSYEPKLKDNLLKEKQHDIQWWRDLLKALDINIDTDNIIFRDNVAYASKNGKSSSKESDVIIKIDPKNPVLIENKGSDVDLDKPEHRSSFDNTNRMVTPLQQVWDYYDLYVKNNGCNPKYIITMNFHTIRVYDMSNGPRGLIKSKEFKTNKNIDAYIPNFIFTFDGDNDNDPSSRKNNDEMPKPLDIRNDDNAAMLRRILSGKDVPDAEITSKQIAEAMVSIRDEILNYIVKSKLNQTSINNADINAYNEFINAIVLLMFMGRSGILSESDNPDDSEFEKWLSNTENSITNNNAKPENAFKRLFTWLGADNESRSHLDSMVFEQFIGAVAGSGYYFKPICGDPFINDATNNTVINVPPIPVEVFQKIKQSYIDYNWQNIDAALFGSMQEDLLNDVKILDDTSNTHIKVSTSSGLTRKQGGIHWTAKQYIHSVIDPLFLDDLQAKVSNVINPKSTIYSKTHTINSTQVDENGNTISIDVNANPTIREQIEKIQQVHAELASIRLFDPACGSGNFLTESYQSLRHLENLLLKRLAKLGCQITQDDILVSTDSFGGIEIEETGVNVARISMHIARLIALKDLANTKPGDAPVKVDYYADWAKSDGFIRNRIVKDNSLRMDWNDIMPAHASKYIWIKKRQYNNTISFESYTDDYDGNHNHLPQVGSMLADESHGNVMVDYIAVKPVQDVMVIGNPPFVSAVNRSDEQTSELVDLMGDDYQGFTDYCAAWLYKSADYIKPASDASFTLITTAGLVMGQSAMKVIQPLIDKHNVHMQFARTKFSWNDSSNNFDTSKALVDVVVTSWVNGVNTGKIKNCRIYDALNKSYTNVNAIDSYLRSNNNLRVVKSTDPISNNIIKAIKGFEANDNGTLTITDDELNEALNDTVIKNHPEFIVKCINSQWLLTGSNSQYFLWLKDSTQLDRDNSPFISKHVEACRKYRCNQTSKSSHAAKLKDTPWLTEPFINPTGLFLAIPKTFSTKYHHVMGDYFDSNKAVCRNSAYLINSSDMMQYSLIQSAMYYEWLNLVGGKMRSVGYNLSPTLSWHTFPVPNDLSSSMRARLRASGKRIMIALTDDPAGSLQLVVDKLHAYDKYASMNISAHISENGLPDDVAWGVLDDVDDEAFIRLMMGRRTRSLSDLNDSMPSILKSAYEYNDKLVDECIVNNAYTKYNTKNGSAWDALIDDRLFNEHLELIKYPLDSNGRVDCLSKAYQNMTATTTTSK